MTMHVSFSGKRRSKILLGNLEDKKCFHSFDPDFRKNTSVAPVNGSPVDNRVGKLQQRNKMDTKERILQGAKELFFRYGIKSVTMDDIAKHLGMSKKTIYQFYTDKDEIVFTLGSVLQQMHSKTFAGIAASAKDPIDEILQTMRHLGTIFSQMNPNMFYDLQKYHPKSWENFKNFKEKVMMEMVITNIEKGRRQGLYRADIDPMVVARLRIEEVEMGMNPVIFPPDKFKLVDVEVALLDHWMHGICTIKGHKLINKYRQVTEEE
jgi:TetR/AcrR family transcriptional regulator, cholesterol catabolism regulator